MCKAGKDAFSVGGRWVRLSAAVRIECLEGVTLRPNLSIYQGSIVGPVLPHELTFYAVRLSKFVV
jgi:hypothetical protein